MHGLTTVSVTYGVGTHDEGDLLRSPGDEEDIDLIERHDEALGGKCGVRRLLRALTIMLLCIKWLRLKQSFGGELGRRAETR